MISLTNSLATHRHQEPEKETDHAPQEDSVERFRSLLGDMVHTSTQVHNPGGEHGEHHDSWSFPHELASKAPCSANHLQLFIPQSKPRMPDELQLRAVTGPLTGLLITAGWQGGRLVLRLAAPSTHLIQRLTKQGGSLEQALAGLLDVDVTVEVAHE